MSSADPPKPNPGGFPFAVGKWLTEVVRNHTGSQPTSVRHALALLSRADPPYPQFETMLVCYVHKARPVWDTAGGGGYRWSGRHAPPAVAHLFPEGRAAGKCYRTLRDAYRAFSDRYEALTDEEKLTLLSGEGVPARG